MPTARSDFDQYGIQCISIGMTTIRPRLALMCVMHHAFWVWCRLAQVIGLVHVEPASILDHSTKQALQQKRARHVEYVCAQPAPTVCSCSTDTAGRASLDLPNPMAAISWLQRHTLASQNAQQAQFSRRPECCTRKDRITLTHIVRASIPAIGIHPDMSPRARR
jgi:hypothetical protein